MSKIKIYVACHKECFIPKHDLFYPIQVGTSLTEKKIPNFLYDNEGENISQKNKMYCELTAQYWVWKNVPDLDYYGFFHYRRYFNFSEQRFDTNPFNDAIVNYLDDSVVEKLGLQKENLEKIISNYDLIIPEFVNLRKWDKNLKSIRHQYEITPYQYKEDLDVMLDIIKEKYPEFYNIANYYLDKSPVGYFCNMFIMKKELFQQYSEWLFTILEEHEKRRDYKNYSVAGYRVSGYLGERLFGIYCTWLKQQQNIKILETQRTLFQNVEINQMPTPAFNKNNIAVALAANDYFAPYMAVTLQSIVENSSDKNNYDILILTSDITADNKNRIESITASKSNFKIRYINPAPKIEGYDFFIRGHFALETYYRLVLPELLKDYTKVLYLDSDMIVKVDVAELFNENIDGYLLAACHDADTAGLYNGAQPDKKKYTDEILKLKEPYQYFQAGTILFNLEEFRNAYSTKEILEFSSKEKWQLLDQDILNKLCEGRVKFIDMSWNVMVDFKRIRIKEYISLAPKWLYDMYMEARKNPKIIHYAGPEKPWYVPDMDMADEFWKYARKNPFYEIILWQMRKRNVEKIQKTFEIKSIYNKLKRSLKNNGLKLTLSIIINKLLG